ncbi:MAG TPA: TIGR03000 domain-containing protein, partial [Gemmataceae bacterium]
SYAYIPAYTDYYTYAPPVAVPVIPTEAPPVAVASNPLPVATRLMYYNPSDSANKPATIIVHVPEDATLLVNGKRTRSTSSTRLFYSPPLGSGKSYHYDFEARIDRDGQTVKARKRVEVGAGDRREISITMPDLDQSSERQSPARLPAENRDLPARPTPPESK